MIRIPSVRNSETINAIEQKLLPFIRPLENNIFNIFNPEELKLLTCLRLRFSHLNEHRFQHNFQECLNPLCSCSLETENTSPYLLQCHNNTPFHTDLTNSIKTFSLTLSPYQIVKKLKFFRDNNKKNSILSASINYINKTKCFDYFLFD